jgi:hypothetical protein
MATSRNAILCMVLLIGAFGALSVASPGDDEVGAFLKRQNMLGLLEVQLNERIRDAKDQNERVELAEQLAQLYLDRLRSFGHDDPYREIVLNQANAFVAGMSSIPMYDLRISLLIESYLMVESKVELARLELLDQEDRASAIDRLTVTNRTLGTLSSKLDPAVELLERSIARSNRGTDESASNKLSSLRRNRSLAHYYHAWTGYSLAVLKDQHVPRDVFLSFGWLLGAKGEMPQFSSFNKSTLEFEHVARSAIGLALAYAQSEDAPAGRSWGRLVVESKFTDPDSVRVAQDRLLQIMAMDKDWTDAYRWALTIEKERGKDSQMKVGDARFLALRSLGALGSSRVGRGGSSEAKKVARYAIEQLVGQGEIGHVLDLYRRFDSLPLVADSFITLYARALGELNKADGESGSGMYASVAALFAQALDAPDADRFPNERDDCALKLAFAEIRSGRPKEAIKVSDRLIKQSTNDATIEEARWIRIAAIDSVDTTAGRVSSQELEDAVREYILAYPSTARSAKLILRHAMQGTIDPAIAIDTLSQITDDDPIALPARRTLVGLQYKQLRATGFADEIVLGEVLEMIRWTDEHTPDEIAGDNDARARMGTIRIGIDLAMRATPVDIDLAMLLVERGMGLLSYDPTLAKYRSELVYRQVEIATADDRVDDAMDLLDELEPLDSGKAGSARVVIFNDTIRRWQSQQTTKVAKRLTVLGPVVLAKSSPPYPEPLGIQGSAVGEAIAQAGMYLWTSRQDVDGRDLAFRVSLMVLARGQPSESGLRLTVVLANETGDQAHELEAWLRLLAAYPSTTTRWYEARYESLRVMVELDPIRARKAYAQYTVLHPSLGPEPYNTKIAVLFGDSVPVDSTKGATP